MESHDYFYFYACTTVCLFCDLATCHLVTRSKWFTAHPFQNRFGLRLDDPSYYRCTLASSLMGHPVCLDEFLQQCQDRISPCRSNAGNTCRISSSGHSSSHYYSIQKQHRPHIVPFIHSQSAYKIGSGFINGRPCSSLSCTASIAQCNSPVHFPGCPTDRLHGLWVATSIKHQSDSSIRGM